WPLSFMVNRNCTPSSSWSLCSRTQVRRPGLCDRERLMRQGTHIFPVQTPCPDCDENGADERAHLFPSAPRGPTMTVTAARTRTHDVRTRRLLAGLVAAPVVFGVVSLAQAFTREGFDLVRFPISMLSNGDLGWLQITNFVV